MSNHRSYAKVNHGEVVTTHCRPPIPSNQFDWIATYEDYDGAPDAGVDGNWIGYGATEIDAIASLFEQSGDSRSHESVAGHRVNA